MHEEGMDLLKILGDDKIFEQLEIDYRMGGLLPHWHNYNRHGISKPDQVAEHWNEVETQYQMPISGEI